MELLRECEREAGASIGGIGIGCTGPVDPVTGILGNVDLLPGWREFPLTARLRDEFDVEVALENDADAAALAETAWGTGRDAERFIYVTVGTGIGVGLVFDGRLYRGAAGAHPEIGHQVIDASGPACYCGAAGCWESLASGPAMLAWAAANAAGEALPHPLTGRVLCELARSGHALARRSVERTARYLGMGLANLVTTFCPDRIALGGGVMENADLFLPGALAVVTRSCGLVPVERTVIAPSALGGRAALLGAARVWHHRFSELPKAQLCS